MSGVQGLQSYTVRRNDTLAGIALRYKMKPTDIKRINRLLSNELFPGQVIRVNALKQPSGTIKKPSDQPLRFIQYTVQPHDTLSSIALSYSSTTNELKKVNELGNTQIQVNQTLLIPLRYALDPSQACLTKIRWPSVHTVRGGESIRSLARFYRTTKFDLMVINGMTTEKLKIGQQIKVFNNRPNQEPSSPSDTTFIKEKSEQPRDSAPPSPLGLNYEGQTSPLASTSQSVQTTQPTPIPIDDRKSDSNSSLRNSGTEPLVLEPEPGIILIPREQEYALCTFIIESTEKIIIIPKNPERAARVGCPKEILMRNIAQPKVVVRKEVVHSGFVSQIEELGELKYLQLPVVENDELKHYYFGMRIGHCEPFCYRLFQILCEFKLEEETNASPKPQRIEVGPPRLTDRSEIFREKMSHGLQMIRNNLPEKYKFYPWCLVYSTDRDGVSLRTFYKKMESWRVSMLFIEDSKGYVFGGFASGSWEIGAQYTGSGECFLFQLYPEAQLYPWFPQSNNCFMLSKYDHIEMGAGGGPGIWLDQDFHEGYSGECGTFRSPSLSSTEDFVCSVFEVWSFDTSNLTDYY